jgi:hypothetical protein
MSIFGRKELLGVSKDFHRKEANKKKAIFAMIYTGML